MFHRYVDHNGQKIDYDRASWLMDKEAFEKAFDRLANALNVDPFDVAIARRMNTMMISVKHTPGQTLQILWDLYCQEHAAKHGAAFDPDVM